MFCFRNVDTLQILKFACLRSQQLCRHPFSQISLRNRKLSRKILRLFVLGLQYVDFCYNRGRTSRDTVFLRGPGYTLKWILWTTFMLVHWLCKGVTGVYLYVYIALLWYTYKLLFYELLLKLGVRQATMRHHIFMWQVKHENFCPSESKLSFDTIFSYIGTNFGSENCVRFSQQLWRVPNSKFHQSLYKPPNWY